MNTEQSTDGDGDRMELSEPAPQQVKVSYSYSTNLPALLEALQLGLVATAPGINQLITVGVEDGELKLGFSPLDQPFGITRTKSGCAVSTADRVWSYRGHEVLSSTDETNQGEVGALVARHCWLTGPLRTTGMVECGGALLCASALFNCVAAVSENYSFEPRWKPPFVEKIEPLQICGISGLATDGIGATLAFVSMWAHGEKGDGNQEGGEGCILDARSNRIVSRGLTMPVSPRVHRGQLLWLEHAGGTVMAIPLKDGKDEAVGAEGSDQTIAKLDGFPGGLDCWGNWAAVGVSSRRWDVIEGNPSPTVSDQAADGWNTPKRQTGFELIHIANQDRVAWLHFSEGVDQIGGLVLTPGWGNPKVLGPGDRNSRGQPWVIPQA